MHGVTIQCDLCNWSEYTKNPLDWFNKKCPNGCNYVIINEEEKKLLEIMEVLEKDGIITEYPCEEHEKEISDKLLQIHEVTPEHIKLHLDTKYLRK